MHTICYDKISRADDTRDRFLYGLQNIPKFFGFQISFIFLRFRNERISIERDLPPERDAEYVVAIMNNVQIIMIAIAVLLSVAYIFSKTGADNVKPL